MEVGIAAANGDGVGTGEADEADADDGDDGVAWVVPRSRVLLPLLVRGMAPLHPLAVGDTVFAMSGGWREALVEAHEQGGAEHTGRYRVHHGRGEWRWADGGELAWHDIAPMKFDVALGKPMLARHAALGSFHCAVVEAEQGAGFRCTFDSGLSSTLLVSELRERWTLPLRVLGLHGDYRRANVLEALGGLLRVQFTGGTVKWTLPEQASLCDTLARSPPRRPVLVSMTL